MGRTFFTLLLMLTAAPVAAQSATSLILGKQVYSALQGNGTSTAAIGGLLRDSINGLEGVCPSVGSYQIFRQTKDTTTLKVECSGRLLYLLSVGDQGRMQLSGGDGRVAPILAIDGPVVAADVAADQAEKAAAPAGRPDGLVTDPRTNDQIPVAAVASDEPDAADVDSSGGWARWIFAGVLATAGLLAFFLCSWLLYRARTMSRPKRLAPYSSDEKDQLVAEGRQIARDIWEHPSGLFIVRGHHGKRRLFPNRLYAYLYRRWGLKISQLR